MAKKKNIELKWHTFLPAIGALVITFIFSQNAILSLEVGVVVLVFSLFAMWVGDR